mgnify:CR=1 FL=1
MFHPIVSYFKVTLLADRILLISAFLGTFTASHLNAQNETYYTSVYGMSGSELKITLNSIIDDHNSISYDNVWDAHKDLYQDPNNSSKLSSGNMSQSSSSGSPG